MTDANLLDDVTRTNIANARKRGLYFNLYKNLGNKYSYTQIPFLEKNHILDPDIPAKIKGSGCVYFTSGTTSHPKSLYYSVEELEYLQKYIKWFCQMEKIAGREKVAVLLGQSFWGVGYITVQGHILSGNEVTPIDTGLSENSIIEILNQYQPTVISSYASFLLKIIKGGLKLNSLKLIETTGEMLDHNTRTLLEKGYHAPIFDAYGLTEGIIGIECISHDGYHFRSDFVRLEIIDPISCKPVKDDSWGELVLTVLCKSLMPIIRYRTGDICKISTKPCSCGNKNPRIWLQGRRMEKILLLYDGVKIFQSDIEKVLFTHFKKNLSYTLNNKTTSSGTTLTITVNSSDKHKILAAKEKIEKLNYEMIYLLNMKKLKIILKAKP